jgi:subtilase family serine protease
MGRKLKLLEASILLLGLLVTFIYLPNITMTFSPEAVEATSSSGSLTYISSPTNFSFTPGVKAKFPLRAYDRDNTTYAMWSYTRYYSAYGQSNGYFELLAYGPSDAPPRGSIITGFNLSVAIYFLSKYGVVDATMNITFVVGPSDQVVLEPPFQPEPYQWYNKTWAPTEPIDGVWTWEDLSNLRFRLGRYDPGDADTTGLMRIYEIWAVVEYVMPEIHVNPKSQSTQPLTITLNITNVEELYGFEFKLYYNARVLTATSVTLGPFLNDTAGTANTQGYVIEINDRLGYVWATQTIKGDIRGGRVPLGQWGVLATIDFVKDADGNSNLDLEGETKLVGFNFVPVTFRYGEAVKSTYTIDHIVVQPVHEIAITSVVPSKTLIDVNETITVDTTVLNEGDYNETFDVKLYADDTLIGTQTVSNLVPGATQTITFVWDTTGFAGTYNITAIAETLGPPPEADTADNIGVGGLVYVGPDIAIVSVEPNATVIWSGDPVLINVTVKNEGGTNITSFDVTTYASATLINTTTITDFEVNATIWFAFTWDTTSFANGSYSIRSNATILTGEKDDADNVRSGGIVYIGPDVAVLEVVPDPTIAYVGDTVSINVTVKNEGARDVSFDVKAWVNDTLVGTEPITALPPGANTTKTFSWTPTANGTYTVWANTTILLGENDTTDNTMIDGTVYVGPDIAVLSVSPFPTRVYVGDSVDVTVTVKNEGAQAETFDVKVFVEQTSTGTVTQINETQTVVDLGSGMTETLTFTWDTTGFSNDIYLVFANITILPGETDTADNTKVDGTVYIGPDVAVTGLVPSPTGVYAGDPVDVTVTVKNEGAQAETIDVTTFANLTLLNSTSNISLDPGVSKTFSFTWDTSGFANGTYIIWANVTVLPGEVDTADNNITDGTVYIGPDIAVSGITYVSELKVYQKEIVTVRVKVFNEGGKETFNVQLYANETLIATKEVKHLEGGKAESVTFTWNTSTFARGNYWIKAVIPALPGETDTADNSFIYPSMVRVKLLGDINDDGKVDVYDTYLLGKAYNSQEAYRSTPRSPNWNPDADFNGDNFILLDDLQALSDNYGKTG